MKKISIISISILLISTSLFAQENIMKPDFPGEIMVDIGLNTWNETPEDFNQKAWPSKSLGIYYTKRKLLGSKISFNYGLGLGFEKIDLGESNTLFDDGGDAEIDDFPFDTDDSPVSKNRLGVTYLDVPLDFRFYPKGTTQGEGFFVGVGGIGGLRLNSKVKWKYADGNNNKIQKFSGQFDLNNLRYGYQVRVGFKGIHLFFKQYLSNMFTDELDEQNPKMTSFGINLSGF